MASASAPAPRKAALAFIFVTILIDSMGIGLIVPVLPTLIQQLGGGPIQDTFQEYGLIASLYALMIFLCSPLLGALSDAFGRRPVLLFSLLGQGIDYLIMAVAPSLTWIAIGRAFAGVTGASITTAQAYIADVTPPQDRAKSFGLIGMAFGMGFILGPALGGLLGELGPRVPFYAAAGLALTNALYGLLVLPESLPATNRSKLHLRRANPFGSLLYLRRFPAILGLIATYALIMLSGQIMPSIWALYTKYRFNWGPAEIGWSLAFVGFVVGGVQGGLTRVIIPRIGEHRAVRVGILIAAAGLLLYGFSNQPWMMYAFMVPYALSGITTPSLQALMTTQVGPNEQGQLQGTLTALMSAAAFVAPLMYTNVFAWFTGPSAPAHLPGMPWWLAAVIMVAALLVALPALARAPKVTTVPIDSPASGH